LAVRFAVLILGTGLTPGARILFRRLPRTPPIRLEFLFVPEAVISRTRHSEVGHIKL
jgi:hypothetical protein